MNKVFTIITLCSLSTIIAYSPIASSKTDAQLHQISVSGQANVSSVPDLFQFSVYVEEQGERVQDLNTVVADKTQDIISSVLAFGVDEKDVQSMRVQLNPWYEHSNNQRIQKGFKLSREINFTLRDIELYDQVIDAVLTTGANRIDGFNYVVENPQPQYLTALDLALKDAKLRASRMANTLGVKLGKVITINENSGYSPLPRGREVIMMSKSSDSLPGQINTGAQVNVIFELVE
jgi:uncharacterized protein YggE